MTNRNGRDAPPAVVDAELSTRINQAVGLLQEAMDAALLAGLVVGPEFRFMESRRSSSGMRVDSFVCELRVYRRIS